MVLPMNRAGPVELRKAMDAALAMMKAGILFVPMPVKDHDDHTQLAAECGERLESMAQEADKVEAMIASAPPLVDPSRNRYFINRKSRLTKMFFGVGAAHEANVVQAKKERFVEVDAAHYDEFRAETAKAKAAGWKPFGRTSYATFMGRLKSE
jgi:hypothetical protein